MCPKYPKAAARKFEFRKTSKQAENCSCCAGFLNGPFGTNSSIKPPPKIARLEVRMSTDCQGKAPVIV